ncbi:MAG: uroporphyrinogen-III synthase [bacterium]|nr:uroporphyrinogen-III synthase [bacterium]
MIERSDDQPLAGISVLITRAREQSAGLLKDLTARGAVVAVIPAVSISPLPEPEGLARAMARVDSYDNIVFTSSNGVACTLQLLEREGIKPKDLPPALCVGEKTAGVWKGAGGRVGGVPEKYTAEALLDSLEEDLSGRSFLIMRPEVVKTDLGKEMSLRGAAVEEVVIYRTVAPEEGTQELRELLGEGGPDVVLFASPSAVEGIVKMAGAGSQEPGASILDMPVVCIGPTTAKAAEEAGFTEIYFPDEHTAEGMVSELMVIAGALKKHAARRIRSRAKLLECRT